MFILLAVMVWLGSLGLLSDGPRLGSAGSLSSQEQSAWDPRHALIQPGDLPGEFRLAASGGASGYSRNWAANELVSVRSNTASIWPSGIRAVRSYALVARTADDVAKEFERLASEVLRIAEPVDLEIGAGRARAGIIRGIEPFASLSKVIVFQADDITGYVSVGTYEAPSSFADVAELVDLVISRARLERAAR